MKKILLLFFIIALPLNLLGQNLPFNFRIDAPDFIPTNENFQISALTRFYDVDARRTEFFLLHDANIILRKVTLRSETQDKNISFTRTNFGDFTGRAYSINIGFDKKGFDYSQFYQIIFEFHTVRNEESQIGFGLKYQYSGASIDCYSSFDTNHPEPPLPIVNVNFYKSHSTSGKALMMDGNSKLDISLKDGFDAPGFMMEYWLMCSNSKKNFFNVFNSQMRDTLLSLSCNKYDMLTPQVDDRVEFFSEIFISECSWNHFVLLYSEENQHLNLFVNENLALSFPINNYDINQIDFEFFNGERNKSFSVDQLRVWDFYNSIDLSFANKHYNSYQADSSSLLLTMNFNDSYSMERISESELWDVTFENLKSQISDAPIFSRAPELNIFIYSNFLSIEWESREIDNVESFILERSGDGVFFNEIFYVGANNDPNSKYYFSDPKNSESEVIYYRLKQINNDETIAYSSQVKIGQGDKTFFTLDQNFPNPFNPETKITIEVLESSEIELTVFDLVGKKISTLYSGTLGEGVHTYSFDGANLPSGIYFVEAKSPTSVEVRKMILAK